MPKDSGSRKRNNLFSENIIYWPKQSNSMKAVASVVAVIMIIIITLVIVASTVYWFSIVTQRANDEVKAQQQAEFERQGKKIRITNYNDTFDTIYIKNVGTTNVTTEEIIVYVNSGAGNLLTPCPWNNTVLQLGETAQCIHTNSCPSGNSLKVSGPANFDIVVC